VCVVTAGIVSLIALTIAARRSRRWPVIARWSLLLLLVETATALATLPLMYFGVLLGVMERVQVAVVSLWLFVIAGQLYADRRRPSPRREPGDPAGHRTPPGPGPSGIRPKPSSPTPPAGRRPAGKPPTEAVRT
jgi:hypothetical protein